MAPDSRPSATKRPGDRRTTIRDAACRLFVARGFASVSIDDIAGAVGISAPAVYRHYRNKQELLEAAVDTALSVVEQVLATSVSLDEALDGFAQLGVDNRDFGVLIVREAAHLGRGRLHAIGRVRGICLELAERMSRSRTDLEPRALGVLARGLFAIVVATSFNPICDGSPEYVHHLRRVMAVYCGESQLADDELFGGRASRDPELRRRPWLSRSEALLAEAPILITERGSYGSTTLDDIGAAVGMSGASVYTYFPSKAELFQAAAARSYNWSNADLERALALSTSGADVMRSALLSFVELADAFATVAIEPEHVDFTGPDSVVAPLVARNTELWWECIRAARPGLEPVAQNALTYAMLGLVNALRRSYASDELTPDAAKSVSIAMQVVLRV